LFRGHGLFRTSLSHRLTVIAVFSFLVAWGVVCHGKHE
jgi:hypothetical protein